MVSQSDSVYLNIADICLATRALGPGLRSAIWVQGCPIHCNGCISPEWIPMVKAKQMTPDLAAKYMISQREVEGITISGGEPALQARNLARMVKIARESKNLHVICFTGYLFEDLINWPESSGIHDLLGEVDLLIDGPYEKHLNNGLTFAGSSNQRMIFLSDRPVPDQDRWKYRKVELHIRDGKILTVGIPPLGWQKSWITSPFGTKELRLGERV